MNVYELRSRRVDPVVEIDTTKPIVIFDPWPFASSEVALAHNDHYFLNSNGTLSPRRGSASISAIHSPSNLHGPTFLATATDGKLVLGKVPSLDKAGI